MTYDVVVVGGGIGGLTTAALLAARGVSVCVCERESRGGGCAASFESFGYEFEMGAGLYAGWGAGEIHERVFAELPVSAPAVELLSPAYVVRLADGTDVRVGGAGFEEFCDELRRAFPECDGEAVGFYRDARQIADALQRAAARVPDLAGASRFQRARLIASEARAAPRVLAAMNHTAAQHLSNTSERFRRFVDAQLQIFAQRAGAECAYLYACVALDLPLRGMHALRGGAQALADTLTESVKKSGGEVRFDAPVLRLAYDAAGRASGVDLLSGERIEARRAVVSNLTVWDTYGKLVGTSRTPLPVRARLKILRGWGAYLLFLGMDEETANRLTSTERVLALTDMQSGRDFDPENNLFMFSAAHASDTRAPAGKRAVTVSTFTDAEQWFSFHEDEAEHEAQDQRALEDLWARLHAAMPQLGAGVEVIDTLTPRGFYERTRRRLGMVGGVGQSLDTFGAHALTHRTPLPNLYIVGDTTFPGNGVAAVTHSALVVADEIAPR